MALVALLAAVLLRYLLEPWVGNAAPFSALYAAVAFAVWYGGYRPALVVTALGYLASNYFFIDPRGTFAVEKTGDQLALGLFLFICFVIIGLGEVWRQSQRSMRRSLEFHDAVKNNMGEGLYAVDSDGCVTYMNPAAEALFGFTFEELKGRKMHDMTHHSHPDGSPLRIEECAGFKARTQGKSLKDYDDWFIRKDGSFFPVTCSSSPLRVGKKIVGMVAVFRDNTERYATRESLRAKEAELELVMSRTPLLLTRCSRDLRYSFANRAYADFIGRSEEEIVGRPIGEIIGQAALATIMPHIERVLMGEAVEFETEVQYKQPGQRFMRALYTPYRDPSGEVVGWVATIIDITERKKLEREREERAAELAAALGERTEEARRAEKAEQLLREADRRKDDFLAILAHELRGPLAPLRNLLEIMNHAEGDGDQLRQARDMMQRQLGQLVRLVDDLLDMSRITRDKIELRKERVELASVIHQSVEACRPLAERAGHQLSVTLPPQPIDLNADPVRLIQVFSNMLSNACKYMEPSGRVWLSAERQGSDAVVTIKDTGMGIPQDQLGRVFEPFTQIDRTRQRAEGGLGIGLSLVKRLVEMHDGSVTAHSEGPGKGSQFVVRLPVLLDQPKREAPRRVDVPVVEPHRILVVDDNIDAATSLARLLEMSGNQLQIANDGLEAIEKAEKFRPDVILLDIGLPKLNGYDACRQIRQQDWGQATVIVALTGWGQEGDRRKSKEAGFDGHLVKPVDYAALMTLIAQKQASNAAVLSTQRLIKA